VAEWPPAPVVGGAEEAAGVVEAEEVGAAVEEALPPVAVEETRSP